MLRDVLGVARKTSNVNKHKRKLAEPTLPEPQGYECNIGVPSGCDEKKTVVEAGKTNRMNSHALAQSGVETRICGNLRSLQRHLGLQPESVETCTAFGKAAQEKERTGEFLSKPSTRISVTEHIYQTLRITPDSS